MKSKHLYKGALSIGLLLSAWGVTGNMVSDASKNHSQLEIQDQTENTLSTSLNEFQYNDHIKQTKDLQYLYTHTLADLQQEVFGDKNGINEYGVTYLDREQQKIVIGLIEQGDQTQEFKKKVLKTLPHETVQWKTVNHSMNKLMSKVPMVYEETDTIIENKENNYQIRYDMENNRLELLIDHITSEQRQRLIQKFGSMLSIHVNNM
ncbi:hypothetical protein N780_03820 [Pontibacillus chungwhensis BH030062]|uniref:Uncharacterized protein n=1 Tax=Pontibacillus chungwhensis BH030062 TaxID=1385513 RepID=A0A0A2UV47_9BACI|nr:hypothetical protein [Pontibacillus chungwhensis]KGP90648.1 hypothetical protein N780_03820 [Pontibacillus chungwhensis BH030062]